MKPPKDSLLLIDGHALLHRSFHALPPLKTKNGLPTNAVYGFIATILKAFEEFKPKYCAVAFDLSGPTFRHKAYEGYKASRAETPTDLVAQMPYAYQVVEALNIPIFTKEGFEADDVIGTLATQAKKKKVPVVIVTGDRDTFQLVDDEAVFVYMIRRAITDTILYDEQAVKERMGVTPKQIIDFKALAGDSSDEIPGINGIGEKTAVTILSQAKSIDILYDKLKSKDDLDGVSERIRQKLIEGEKSARQSYELAKIDCDVSITIDLDACKIHDYDATKASAVLQKLEFFSLVKRLPNLLPQESKVHNPTQKRDWQYEIIATKPEIETMVKELSNGKVLALDTESDSLRGDIIGISLAGNGKRGYYIPLIKEHGAKLSKLEVADILRPLITNKSISKIGHNIKYDLHSLDQLGLSVSPVAFDTMVAAYVLHAHMRNFDLETLSMRELGYTMISFQDVAQGKGKDATLVSADGEKVAEYAAEDAIITYRLYEVYQKQLAQESSLKKVAETIDFPLVPVLFDMEKQGVCLDKKILIQLEKELEKEIDQLREKIENYAKEPINVNSPAQLQKLLFEDLGLAKGNIKTTKTGISTAAGELEKLQGLHPVVDLILRYRELTKLQSTYVLTLPHLIDSEGRVHTQFSQTTAATGRLASNDPNLQNIPIRTELGNKIREAFVAPKGYSFVSLDYSQFELRIIAHLSEDKQLQQVFLDGRDIHDEVAKRLKIDRRAAKAINFGIIYGLSAFGLSRAIKISPPLAKEYIDAYFATYKGLADYLTKTKVEIREKGYVETLFGRRREIPEIYASNAVVRAAAERMAINMPAQGTESDIMKLAMIEIEAWLDEEYGDKQERPYMVLQVHDSLLFEVPEAFVKPVIKKVKSLMEDACKLSVPLIADPSIGKNWGQLEKI